MPRIELGQCKFLVHSCKVTGWNKNIPGVVVVAAFVVAIAVTSRVDAQCSDKIGASAVIYH